MTSTPAQSPTLAAVSARYDERFAAYMAAEQAERKALNRYCADEAFASQCREALARMPAGTVLREAILATAAK